MEPQVFERFLPPFSQGAISSNAACLEMKPQPSNIGELFTAEESGLLRFAIGMVRRRSVAEELVQETFLRLHQVWSQVENPRGWIYRSLRNLALNHLRDHPLEAELHEETATVDTRPAPEMLGREEAAGMVRLLLTEIPEEDRALILLKYHDDLKYHEISRRTGLSVSNVGYRLHHVLKSLGESLRRVGVEGSQG